MSNNEFNQIKNKSLLGRLGICSFTDVLSLLTLLAGFVWIIINFIIKPLTQDPTYNNSKYSNLREYKFPSRSACMNELDKMAFYEIENKGTDEGLRNGIAIRLLVRMVKKSGKRQRVNKKIELSMLCLALIFDFDI